MEKKKESEMCALWRELLSKSSCRSHSLKSTTKKLKHKNAHTLFECFYKMVSQWKSSSLLTILRFTAPLF